MGHIFSLDRDQGRLVLLAAADHLSDHPDLFHDGKSTGTYIKPPHGVPLFPNVVFDPAAGKWPVCGIGACAVVAVKMGLLVKGMTHEDCATPIGMVENEISNLVGIACVTSIIKASDLHGREAAIDELRRVAALV